MEWLEAITGTLRILLSLVAPRQMRRFGHKPRRFGRK
jgi:hypothetical protein